MRIRNKLLIIFAVFSILLLLYKMYRYEIFVWSCNNEGTVSSCMLAGKIMEERGEYRIAEKHLLDSCGQDYAIGCYHLAMFYTGQGRDKEAVGYAKKACRLGHTSICKNQEKHSAHQDI